MLIQLRIVFMLVLPILSSACIVSPEIEMEGTTAGATLEDSLLPATNIPTPGPTGKVTLETTTQITSEVTPRQEPSPSGADLVVYNMILMMAGQQGHCVNSYAPYGIRVVIENQGYAAAGVFWVGVNDDLQQVETGIPAGESINIHFPGTVPSGKYTAIVDVFDEVKELDEDNNSKDFIAPTPTPPPLCTPTPTPK